MSADRKPELIVQRLDRHAYEWTLYGTLRDALDRGGYVLMPTGHPMRLATGIAWTKRGARRRVRRERNFYVRRGMIFA